MTDRDLWQALGYRVEKRSLGVCGDGYVLLLPDGGYGPGCGEGRGWGNEHAAWAQLPRADTWEGMGLVLEAMEAKGWPFVQLTHQSFATMESRWGWVCRFEGERSAFVASATSAPRVVRLAALRALGVSGE